MKTTQKQIDAWNRAQAAWVALDVSELRTKKGSKVCSDVNRNPKSYLVKMGDSFLAHFQGLPILAYWDTFERAASIAVKHGIPIDFYWDSDAGKFARL